MTGRADFKVRRTIPGESAARSDKMESMIANFNARIDVLEQKVRMRCGGARSGGLKSSVGHVQARSPSATASRLLKLQEDVQKPSLAPAFNQELVDLFFEAKDLGFVVETSASASDNPDRNPTVGEKIGIWRQGMSKVGSSPRFEGGL